MSLDPHRAHRRIVLQYQDDTDGPTPRNPHFRRAQKKAARMAVRRAEAREARVEREEEPCAST